MDNGTVKLFNSSNGYGFIAQEDGRMYLLIIMESMQPVLKPLMGAIAEPLT